MHDVDTGLHIGVYAKNNPVSRVYICPLLSLEFWHMPLEGKGKLTFLWEARAHLMVLKVYS